MDFIDVVIHFGNKKGGNYLAVICCRSFWLCSFWEELTELSQKPLNWFSSTSPQTGLHASQQQLVALIGQTELNHLNCKLSITLQKKLIYCIWIFSKIRYIKISWILNIKYYIKNYLKFKNQTETYTIIINFHLNQKNKTNFP